MLKKFYSVKEASKILGVSTNTIYKYLDLGSLKGKRFNDRGRFKIPYSEIAPYLAKEASNEATENTQINEVSDESALERPEADRGGSKWAFFESLGIPLMGLLVIYLLWSFGKSAAAFKPSLITDIGNAVLGYSDRTFSGFGSFVAQVLPGSSGNQLAEVAQKPADETQAVMGNDTENNTLLGIDTKEKVPDLNYKIADTEGRTTDLYANVQVLSSNAQRLLGKSKTLTSAELNSEIDKMSQFLGLTSDTSEKGTIFAEINWLGENWSFSNVEAVRRAASQVSYLLATLTSKSLAAFTKPDIEDLDNLVIETDSLLGAIGNPSDTSTEKTLYGNIKSIAALAKALDAKIGEIDKILGSWEGYSTNEKESIVKLALSESLSINILAKVEETIFSKLSLTGTDAELKNSLLSAKGVLDANKIHLVQKAGEPLVVSWLESGGDVKILAINPSLVISQKAEIKYYLPPGTEKGQFDRISGGLSLSFDSQKNQYYVEGSPTLVAREVKTISLKNENNKPLAKVVTPVEPVAVPVVAPVNQTSSLPEAVQVAEGPSEISVELNSPAPGEGQVAGVATSSYPTQNIVIWGSVVAIFVLGLIFWLINLKSMLGRGNKKSLATVVSSETSVLLPEGKLDAVSSASARGASHVSFSLPRIEFRAIKKFFANVLRSIYKLFAGIASAVRKIIVFISKGILAVLTSIGKFFANILHAIKKFFTGIISAIRKIPMAIKNGILAIIASIVAFFSKILTSIKNFFVSLVKGFVKLITSFIASIKRGFLAVLHAIKAFFLGIISAVRRVIVSIKKGMLSILSSIATFFLKVVTSIKNFIISLVKGIIKLIASFIASIKRGFFAVIHAIKAFFLGLISAVRKVIISIKTGIVAILTSIVTFFSKILTSIKNFFVFLAKSLVKLITSVVDSFGKGYRAFIRAVTTFFTNILHAVTTFYVKVVSAIVKTVISIKKAILNTLASIKAFFLKVLFLTLKLVSSIITGLVNFVGAVIASVKKGISTAINAVITFIANIISAVTKAITSVVVALQKIAISITTFFLKILSRAVRGVAFLIRRFLKILTSIAKFADFNLSRLDFKTPTIHKSRSDFRSTATFLLIGIASATISGVLAFKFIQLL